MKISCALIIAVMVSGLCSQVVHTVEDADARGLVVKALAEKGLKRGFNAGPDIWVGIGVSIRRVDTDHRFLSERTELHKIAYLNALRGLVRSMGVRMSAESEMRTSGNRNVAIQEIKEFSQAYAQRTICGCTVLCVEEKWHEGELSVAMAVGVSKEAGTRSTTAAKGICGELDGDWRKWLSGVNLETLAGVRQFRDSQGRIRHVGIGLADVQELSGTPLVAALKGARLQSVQSLAFILYADVTIKEVLEKGRACTDSDTEAWEKFTTEVIQRCSRYNPPSVEIFDGDVADHITGRKLHMTISGN